MTPYYQHDGITIYHGDCREILPALPKVDLVLTDPPYGETSCEWDCCCEGWLQMISAPCLWCFGSMRFFLANLNQFAGWRFAQEIVWEKQNGSGFAVDRFNRVHELATQWYRGSWADLHHDTPRIPTDNPSKTVRTRGLTPHRGDIGNTGYVDDGYRLVRSVIRARNEQQRAEHPTQKPVDLVGFLLEYSCAPGGLVLDTFMGSGTTLVAAKRLGRQAIGIEIEEKYCEIAARRVEAERLTLFESIPEQELLFQQ